MPPQGLLILPDFPFKDLFLTFYNDTKIDFYFVGGFVRDMLLNRPIKDIDVVTEKMDYLEFSRLLNRYIKGTVIHFKDNVRISAKGHTIDVSKLRGKSIHEDLSYRDFTINNLAYHFEQGLIGDSEDLRNGKIKMVYDRVFLDDPLRILRCYRFVSEFGFHVDEMTRKKLIEQKELLKTVPSERINRELVYLFTGDYVGMAFEQMVDDALIPILFESTLSLISLYGGKYHIEDVFTHSVSVAKELIRILPFHLSVEDRLVMILAALLHDTGKGDERYRLTPGKFLGHEEISAYIVEKELKKLSFSNKIIRDVSILVKRHGDIRKFSSNNTKDITLLRFAYENYEYLDKIILLSIADARSKKRDDESFYSTIERIKLLSSRLDFSRKSIINGEILIEMGFPKGKKLGVVLKETQFRLVAGLLVSYEEAIKFVKGYCI
ncbi:MAG: HD domain-containing protein [Calditerrivibrio sp.]|nr:HD domain-containing protein [Calditerrivibrio sp.]